MAQSSSRSGGDGVSWTVLSRAAHELVYGGGEAAFASLAWPCIGSVPLAAGVDALDWVAEQGWPVLLVVGMRLGCLNHALLSAEVLSARGLRWAWLANPLPPRQPALEENLQTLQEWMPGSCLRLDQPDWLAQLQAFAGE